jgi:hypothetical protein
MAMGIFEQLAWLTKRVNRLCCAVENQGLKSRNVDLTPLQSSPEYTITGDGIYQFYGDATTSVSLNFTSPVSAGQTIYIVNASDNILIPGLNPPLDGGTNTSFTSNIDQDFIYQLLSMEDFTNPGSFIWRIYKQYLVI